jgi:hypothetical protein
MATMRIVVYDDDKKFIEFIKSTLDRISMKHGKIGFLLNRAADFSFWNMWFGFQLI